MTTRISRDERREQDAAVLRSCQSGSHEPAVGAASVPGVSSVGSHRRGPGFT